MELEEYVADCDRRYSEEHQMVGRAYKGPGYHSRVPDGTWVHPVLDSFNYAIGILESGEASRRDRAQTVIRKALELQDSDPTSRTYGIWPYLLEEPLSEMQAPDWNMADFCGSSLVHILHSHADKLTPDVLQSVRDSLGHAAWAIFRRNVGPNYTNIAIAGAAVTVAAGELLGEPRLVSYGRRRLRRFVEHTEHHGGFNEYNSPGYTMVSLQWCEWMLRFVRDEPTRADAETVRRMTWSFIAEHWHPGTNQWAGPHSRNYQDRLPAGTCRYLSEQTGVEIRPHPTMQDGGGAPRFVPPLPCPADRVERFQRLPQAPLVVRSRFIRRESDEASTWGTTWMTGDACLGTVNHDSLWTQRRPLIAYWRTTEDPAVVLRLRFLHDRRDFASACVRNAQNGPRVLSVVNMLTNQGDWHPSLDRPADARFAAEDFRVRYELTGEGVGARRLDERRFALSAGGYTGFVHTAPGRFGDEELRWELCEEEGKVCVDGVCYAGPRREFVLTDIRDVVIAAGLELLPEAEPATGAPVETGRHVEGRFAVDWGDDFHMDAPSRPEPYRW